jgi:hypothetical protein
MDPAQFINCLCFRRTKNPAGQSLKLARLSGRFASPQCSSYCTFRPAVPVHNRVEALKRFPIFQLIIRGTFIVIPIYRLHDG